MPGRRPPELRRSWLFVGGSDETALEAAAGSGADVVILELEDFTPPAERPKARARAAPLFDDWRRRGIVAGVRVTPLDTPDGPDRLFGVVGVAGLAPQWIEVDADLFVSETGDVSARVDAEYELLITNRLILIPSLEVDVAFTEDREIGVATGLNSVEFGVRLSYDLIDRMLSPYVGVAYERKFGRTADFAREEGEDTSALFGVIGARLMF